MLGTGARYAEYGITGGFFLFTQALILALAFPGVLVWGADRFGTLLSEENIPKLAQPARMSTKECSGGWETEAAAAVAALQAGVLEVLGNVPGTPEVVGMLDVNTADDLDPAGPRLPLWKLGAAHLTPGQGLLDPGSPLRGVRGAFQG